MVGLVAACSGVSPAWMRWWNVAGLTPLSRAIDTQYRPEGARGRAWEGRTGRVAASWGSHPRPMRLAKVAGRIPLLRAIDTHDSPDGAR